MFGLTCCQSGCCSCLSLISNLVTSCELFDLVLTADSWKNCNAFRIIYCVAESEKACTIWKYAFYELLSDDMKCKLEIPSRAVWEIHILRCLRNLQRFLRVEPTVISNIFVCDLEKIVLGILWSNVACAIDIHNDFNNWFITSSPILLIKDIFNRYVNFQRAFQLHYTNEILPRMKQLHNLYFYFS